MHVKRKTKKAIRKKRSPVWLAMPDAEFSELVQRSRHVGDVLDAFGLENVGRNNSTAYARIAALGLSTAHFNVKSRKWCQAFPLEQVLVENSTYPRGCLKKQILAHRLLEEKCAICGLLPEWNGKRLILRLDHVNGMRHDHRLENLRFVCPNCDSQQPTYCGRQSRAFDSRRVSKST